MSSAVQMLTTFSNWRTVLGHPTCTLSILLYVQQEPELLDTLYTAQQMSVESADLALHEALQRFAESTSTSASGKPDAQSISKFVSSTTDAAHKYAQVTWDGMWVRGWCGLGQCWMVLTIV